MKPQLDFELVSKYYDQYVFFYSGFLSNWAMTSFIAQMKANVIQTEVPEEFNDTFQFNCSEQYMMLQKALCFSDYETARLILESNYPGEQKSLGREVKGFDVDTWNKVARAAVYQGCYYKFTQNQVAKEYLLSTDGYLLVEASPTDAVWGIKRGGYEKDVGDMKTWRGANWLGEVLTKLRENLIENSSYQNPYE